MGYIITKKRIENLITEALSDFDPDRYTTKPGLAPTDEVATIWFFFDGLPCGVVKIHLSASPLWENDISENRISFDNSAIDEITPELDVEWRNIKSAINAKLKEFFDWAALKEAEAIGDGGQATETEAAILELWKKIPDVGYNRLMLRMWHAGSSAREIGLRINRNHKTVSNNLSALRQIYGDEIVPNRRDSG
jgi:hypothetical protein